MGQIMSSLGLGGGGAAGAANMSQGVMGFPSVNLGAGGAGPSTLSKLLNLTASGLNNRTGTGGGDGRITMRPEQPGPSNIQQFLESLYSLSMQR
jgi:hypothetical protein